MYQEALQWITKNINNQDIGKIDSLLPNQFAGYFKVFFPLAFAKTFPIDEYRYEPDTIENMNKRLEIGKEFFEADQWEKIKKEKLESVFYKELAKLYNLPYDTTLSLKNIIRKLGKQPIHIQRSFDYEMQMIHQLTQLLETKEKVYFYGNGGHQFESAGPSFLGEWMVNSDLTFFEKLYRQLNENNTLPFPLLPQYVFEENQKWCIGIPKILGTDYFVIGVNNSIAQKLRSTTDIEVMELEYNGRHIG